MSQKKKKSQPSKSNFHPRNKHRQQYDFEALVKSLPALEKFVSLNKYSNLTIDFSDPEAVKTLNKALLFHFYNLEYWDIPEGYLCPSVPGRADYIHHIADLLAKTNNGKVPKGYKIKCLDVGVGANCVYPIIGKQEYGWSFIGTDVDEVSVKSASNIVKNNSHLKRDIEIRTQNDESHIFEGVIKPNDFIDITICNPPFHASKKDAEKASLRKVRNLTGERNDTATLNFGGQSNELWCKGGEEQFISGLIEESKELWASFFWFTTLVSKESNLKGIYSHLKKVSPTKVKTIDMQHGNKMSRIVAWTFLSEQQQKKWKQMKGY